MNIDNLSNMPFYTSIVQVLSPVQEIEMNIVYFINIHLYFWIKVLLTVQN